MAAIPMVGIAAFAVDDAGVRTVELQSAPRLRSASVLKPLLFWVGGTADPFADDRASWEALAQPAITRSDNDTTAALWSRVGQERLLALLNNRTAMAWSVDGDDGGGGGHPSLRVMITAAELARAYAVFASDDAEVATQLRCWMTEVPAEQTFGVRGVACEVLAVDERSVGVKCGWFGGERVHAIVLVETPHRMVGAAVTTFRRPDAASHATVRNAIGNDTALIAAHDALAGQVLRSAVRQALLVAAEL